MNCNQGKVSVTPRRREGIATLGRGTTVCLVRTKCDIYIQHVLGIWFRWSVFCPLRMNNAGDSDIVLNCKAKREEVQKILVFFLEPRVSCPFSDATQKRYVAKRLTVANVRVF